jgi:hypothetical protein
MSWTDEKASYDTWIAGHSLYTDSMIEINKTPLPFAADDRFIANNNVWKS